LRIIYGQGRTIATTPTSVTIGIDDGRSIDGDLAVLATGHDETAKAGPGCYVNPWESPADSGVDRDAAILISGTRLTMMDCVVARANGHRGPIYAMSRRGLRRRHIGQSRLSLKREDIPFGASRHAVAMAATSRRGQSRRGVPSVVDRPGDLAKPPLRFKQRFRHARLVEGHRHRMAPSGAADS
jgi:uncharacterized NAD(P)/FAD-binding protein YdhS